jgi:ribosome-associated protein
MLITRNRRGVTHILNYDSTGPFDVVALKDLIVSSLDDDKATDVEVIDLTGQSALADFIVVASGTSSRQIIRMAEKLRERLAARGHKHLRTEGMGQANWVVCDAGDVIVHLFRPEVREFYNIEKMWSVPSPGAENTKGGMKAI